MRLLNCFLRSLCSAAACILLLLAASHAQSQIIVDAEGFEPGAGYTEGVLQNQSATTGDGGGNWRGVGGKVGTATVQSTLVKDGQQAVRVDRGAKSDDRWFVPVDGYPSSGVDQVCVSWDMLVFSTGSRGQVFGPLFGVEAYDDTITPQVLGSLFVDATTGEVVHQKKGSGILEVTDEKVTFGAWSHFDLMLNFASSSYEIYYEDELLATEGFVDVSGRRGQFTDADIAALAGGAEKASQSQTGTAYFDNFVVHEGSACPVGDVTEPVDADFNIDGAVNGDDFLAWQRNRNVGNLDDWQRIFGRGNTVGGVPEPQSLALLAIGAAGMLLRKRRR